MFTIGRFVLVVVWTSGMTTFVRVGVYGLGETSSFVG